MTLQRIEITNKFDFPELVRRLQKVKLKGFPDVEVYGESNVVLGRFNPEEVRRKLFVPQPNVYATYMNRIRSMNELFKQQDVNIFSLNGGVDYTAFDENGQATEWTIIPPVVENIDIVFDGRGLDYNRLLSLELNRAIDEKGHTLNPELSDLSFQEFVKFLGKGVSKVPIVCDGSHRIHTAVADGIEQTVVLLNPRQGYPYYAAPKPYGVVEVLPDRPEGGGTGKVHVLTEPGHKLLYRLFPTGGILSGDVRPDAKLKGN